MCSRYRVGGSRANEHPSADHLTNLPNKGVGALLSVSAFNHKRAPMLKHIIGQIIKYSGIITDFEVESSRRTKLNGTMSQ